MRTKIIIAGLVAATLSIPAVAGVPTLPSLDDSPAQADAPTGKYLLFPMPKDRILEPSTRGPMVGLFGGPNFAMHTGQFTITQNGITCCTFNDGNGIGFVVGAKVFIPIGDRLDITGRVSYETRPGKFTTLGEPLPILGANNQVEAMQFQDELNTSLSGIVFDPMASFTFTDFGLYVVLGPSFSLVASKGFTKDETIANPAGVDYKTGGTSKRLTAGDIQNVEAFQIGGRGGIGVRIPAGDLISINPEILYTVPFTKVTSLDDWKTSGLQTTIGILFNL